MMLEAIAVISKIVALVAGLIEVVQGFAWLHDLLKKYPEM
jgi:hypothetical protein